MRHSVHAGWIALILCSAIAAAQTPIVDQECLPEIWGEYSIPLGTPIGQEFVPTVTALTFVDLWIVNNPSSLDDTARVFVAIRADSIGGEELGISLDVHIPKPFYDEVRLSFSNPIPLEPGRRYVIEARAEGPGNPLLAEGHVLGTCPGITGIFQGTAFPSGADFWFRTGLVTTPAMPVSWGRLKQLYP